MKRGACLSSIGLAITGIAFIVAGLILYYKSPTIIKKKVKENVELKQGTLVFKNWQKPTSPIYMDYYVFHVKNPQQVLDGKEIPDLEQRGPYSYREIRSNDIRKWSSDNTEVTFMPNRTYIFDPETSCSNCSDNDTFTTANIPLMTTVLWLKNTDYKAKQSFLCWWGIKFVFASLTQEEKSLFYTRTVHELLWGYEDPLIVHLLTAHVLDKKCPIPKGLNPLIQLQYNNTYYGISAINTGQKDIDKLEQYTMWRNEDKLSWWSDNYTNMINGTDGTQFKPSISKTDTLYSFAPDICRSMYLKYSSTEKVRDITVYRFKAPKELYLSGDMYAPNKGFCVPPKCLPTGLLNVTLCQPQNPPIALSPPHFYQGNKTLVEAVKGLHPVASKHETFLDIEPITGIVMQAKKRIQVNAHLEPIALLSETDKNFSKVFLPVMYASERALIDKHDAAEFKKQVYDQEDLLQGVEYGLMGVGGLLVLIALIICVYVIISSKGKGEKTQLKPNIQQPTYGTPEKT